MTSKGVTSMSDRADSTGSPSGGIVDPQEKTGFFSTPNGRVVAVVIGICVVAIVAGIAVAIVGSSLGGREAEEAGTQPAPASPSATATRSAAASAAPMPEVSNSEIFTFRDIFEPLIKPLPKEPTSAVSATATTAPDTATPEAKGALYLVGVLTEDGVMKAQLRLDGKTYTLAEGEPIEGTPWQVFRVTSTSVTMLYGDQRVTLAVGQGISK